MNHLKLILILIFDAPTAYQPFLTTIPTVTRFGGTRLHAAPILLFTKEPFAVTRLPLQRVGIFFSLRLHRHRSWLVMVPGFTVGFHATRLRPRGTVVGIGRLRTVTAALALFLAIPTAIRSAITFSLSL